MIAMGALQDRVAKALAEAGMSQSELASALGVTQQTVNSFMNKGSDRWKLLLDAARILKVRPEWLQDGEGSMRPSFALSLSPEEIALLSKFRAAGTDGRCAAHAVLDALAKQTPSASDFQPHGKTGTDHG